jgi:hypothetical protein
MKVIPLVNLNEDILNPNCPKCGKELSAFSITSTELNTMKIETEALLINMNFLRINMLGIDKHLIYLCKKCCNGHFIKENDDENS